MSEKIRSRLLFLIAVAYAAAVFSVFPRWTIDDAFIYYRYAENLALHGELTWNVGEPPVEGYTGVALPVILAGFIRLGFSPVGVSRAIGIVAYFASLILLVSILSALKIRELVRGAVAIIYATTPILFTHATSGLDTMLFLAAMFGGIYAAILFVSVAYSRWRAVFCSLSLLFLSLVRPEGVAFAGFFILAVLYNTYRKEREHFWEATFIFLGTYFLPALAYFFWRFNYYGQFLPNTFYAKAGGWAYYSNLVDLARFLRRTFAAPLFLLLILILGDVDALWDKIKRGEIFARWLAPLGIAAAAFIVAVLLLLSRTHLIMNYSERFYTTFLPILWIVVALGWSIGLTWLWDTRAAHPLRAKVVLAVFAALVAYQVAFNIAKLRDEKKFTADEANMQLHQHTAIGKLLREIMPPNEWLVSYIDAGAVPYFSKLKTVDFGILNDVTLSRGKLSEKERVDYFFTKNPGAAVFTSTSFDELSYGKEAAAISQDPRFKQYVLVKKFASPLVPPTDYHEFLYLRKDLARKVVLE